LCVSWGLGWAGYGTEVGTEGGRGLSSGEWRRVQLARALAWGKDQAPPKVRPCVCVM
jgi:hypothetical protein